MSNSNNGRAEIVARNDLLRKKFEGGKVLVTATVFHIDPQIREVFEITKLDKLFVICGDEQEGLQKF